MRPLHPLRSVAVALALLGPPSFASAARAQDGADERYQYLVGLYDKELYELAAKEAAAFLAEHPRHAKAALARYRLGSALFELERASEAAPHFRALAADNGFEYAAECWLRLGQCELELDRLTEAELAFSRALASGKDYLAGAASFLAGETAFRRGDYAAAEARYAESLKREPDGPNAVHALRGQAWCDFKSARHQRAAERAARFLAAHADDELAGEMRFLLGEAELAAGRPEAALEAFRTVREGPFLDAALRGAGFACAALGHDAEAAQVFGTLLERFPDGRFAREAALQCGSLLLRTGDASGALRTLSSPAAGDEPETLYWRARAQAETGAKEPALATVQRALAQEPPPELAARLRALAGDLAFDLGRLDEAARAYEASGSDYALHAAAVAHLNAGRHEEAARAARELLEQHPQSTYAASARLALGEACFGLGRHADAIAALAPLAQGGQGVDPALRARALARIAWCRYLAGEHAKAAELFARVAAEHPDAPEAEEARFMAGRAAIEAGDDETAARAFEEYLARHPQGAQRDEALLRLSSLEEGTERLEVLLASHPASAHAERARFELARKLEAAGRRDEAIARYRELLDAHPQGENAPAARYSLAWCLHEKGEPAQATRELELLLAARPGPELALPGLELLVWSARDAGDTERCVSACRAFGEVCRDESRSYAVTEVTARALDAKGQFDEAQRLLEPWVSNGRAPELALRARVERAWIFLHANAPEQAERELQAASALLGTAPGAGADAGALREAAFFVGEAFFERGEFARCAPLYSPAAKEPAERLFAEANYKRGFAALNLDDARAAAASFDAVVRNARRSDLWGECAFLLGESYFRLERYADAVAVLEILRREAPRHETMPKALFRLGLASAQTGEWQRCEAALSELVRKNADFPQRAEAELARGRALAQLDQARGARTAFDWVVANDKGVLAARARLELGRLALAADQTEEALAQFLKVALLFAHEAEVAEALYWAGRCLEAQGEPALARKQYEELLAEHAASPFAAQARERMKNL